MVDLELKIPSELRYFVYSQFYGWKSLLMYRFQVAVFIVNNLVSFAFTIITLGVIYQISSGVPGWTYYQLLFLSFLSSLTFRFVSYVNLSGLPRLLRQGNFDPYFAKPVNTLLLFFSPPSTPLSPIGVAISAILVIYSASLLHFSSIWVVLFLPLYFLGVAALLLFIAMLAVLSYFFMKSGGFISNVVNLLGQTSQYPLNIFGLIPQAIFSILVPVGIASYYSASLLLGRISLQDYLVLVVLALGIILVCRYLIYRLMRGYSGGGG